jgi:hypothetical protein
MAAEGGLLLGQHICAVARVYLEVRPSTAKPPVPHWINEAPSHSDAETILPPSALV